MSLSFEWYVATRYLLARRRQAFIFASGVAVGVMALIIALALMTGMQEDIRDKLIGAQAHVYVHKIAGGGFDDYRSETALLMTVPGVLGAAPSILGQAVASSSGTNAFISIKGIDPTLEAQVTDVDDSVIRGSLQDVAKAYEGVLGGVVVGEELALRLGVSVGDEFSVLSPQSATLSPMGLVPRLQRLRVVGVFSLGLYEYDNAYGFVALDVAGRLFRKDRVDLMELRVADLNDAAAVARVVPETLGAGYWAEDWGQLNRALFSALWLEKMAISISIGLIMAVAALNIVASLILLVMEKSRDIAILKTMGAGGRSIRRIFVLQGGIIGVVGTLVGIVGGLAVSYVADRYQLIQIPGDVYPISWVPFRIGPLEVVLVGAAAILICLLATIPASRRASGLEPAEALRHQ